MANEKKIVVVAGNRDQFRYWLKHNIIPFTSKHYIERLRGIEIEKVYYEGTYYEWLDQETEAVLDYIVNRS